MAKAKAKGAKKKRAVRRTTSSLQTKTGQRRSQHRTPRIARPAAKVDGEQQRTPPSPAQWTVYVLRCKDGSLYTGATNHLLKRLSTHQSGRGAAYTRSRLPVALAYSESAQDRSAALKREWAVKQLSRADKLRLIERGARRRKLLSKKR